MSETTESVQRTMSSRRGSAVTVLFLVLLAGIAVTERSACSSTTQVAIERGHDVVAPRNAVFVHDVELTRVVRPGITHRGGTRPVPRFLRVDTWGLRPPRAPSE